MSRLDHTTHQDFGFQLWFHKIASNVMEDVKVFSRMSLSFGWFESSPIERQNSYWSPEFWKQRWNNNKLISKGRCDYLVHSSWNVKSVSDWSSSSLVGYLSWWIDGRTNQFFLLFQGSLRQEKTARGINCNRGNGILWSTYWGGLYTRRRTWPHIPRPKWIEINKVIVQGDPCDTENIVKSFWERVALKQVCQVRGCTCMRNVPQV